MLFIVGTQLDMNMVLGSCLFEGFILCGMALESHLLCFEIS
jgi:hypothetical protein